MLIGLRSRHWLVYFNHLITALQSKTFNACEHICWSDFCGECSISGWLRADEECFKQQTLQGITLQTLKYCWTFIFLRTVVWRSHKVNFFIWSPEHEKNVRRRVRIIDYSILDEIHCSQFCLFIHIFVYCMGKAFYNTTAKSVMHCNI